MFGWKGSRIKLNPHNSSDLVMLRLNTQWKTFTGRAAVTLLLKQLEWILLGQEIHSLTVFSEVKIKISQKQLEMRKNP